MIYTSSMKVKAPLFFVAALSIVFFLYLLIRTQGCCGVIAVGPSSAENVVVEEPKAREVEMHTLHFGDLMLGRGVARSLEAGVDPFLNIRDFIQKGNFDMVIANLEGPFTHSTKCQIKPYSFRFEPKNIELLLSAGITGVSLANNHSNDCYSAGLEESRSLLSEAGIAVFGDDASSVGEERAVHASSELGVTLLGFDMTLGLQSISAMTERIKDARSDGQRPIVHVHWGDEYEPFPNSAQKDAARLFAESGASLVIGHHPHVIEPFEVIGDTAVFYSLGNFVFDQDTVETQTGYAVEERAVVDGELGAMIEWELTIHPYRIYGHQPTFLEGEARDALCAKVLGGLEGYNVDGCLVTLE